MAFKHITSRDNPIFKQLKRLAESSRERRKAQLTFLDGVHLIESYGAVFGEPKQLIIPEGHSTQEATALLQTLQDVPTLLLPTLMFAELSPVTSPSGILALIDIPQPLPMHCGDWVLLMEDIQDPGNVGSILRTAAAAGVQAAYLSAGCAEAWSPKALRGGQGAQFVLPIFEKANLLDIIQQFDGVCYTTAMDGESLYAQNFKLPTAFIIGNEGQGVSEALFGAADKRITIPTTAKVESLNAGAATAVCLFECARQRLL